MCFSKREREEGEWSGALCYWTVQTLSVQGGERQPRGHAWKWLREHLLCTPGSPAPAPAPSCISILKNTLSHLLKKNHRQAVLSLLKSWSARLPSLGTFSTIFFLIKTLLLKILHMSPSTVIMPLPLQTTPEITSAQIHFTTWIVWPWDWR